MRLTFILNCNVFKIVYMEESLFFKKKLNRTVNDNDDTLITRLFLTRLLIVAFNENYFPPFTSFKLCKYVVNMKLSVCNFLV